MIRRAILILLLLGLAGTAWAAPKQVTIAVGKDSVPYYFVDENGRPQGLVVDLWSLWSQKTGVAVRFLPSDFSGTLQAVRQGRAEIQAGCFKSPERAVYLDFAAPVCTVATNIFVHRNVYGIRSLADLRGLRIGVIQGDYAVEYLSKHLPGAALAIYPSNVALFEAVARGDVLAFVKDTAIGLAMLQRIGMLQDFRYDIEHPLYTRPWWAAVRRGDKSLVGLIRQGLEQITPQERAAVELRWINYTSSKKTGQHLIIACAKDFAPFSMLSRSGQPAGMFVDLWKLWAQKADREVEFRFSDWAETIEEVRRGGADIHSGLFETPERRKFLDFSQPFYVARSGFYYNPLRIKPASIDDLAGRRVAVLANTSQERFLRDDHPAIVAVPVDDVDTMLQEAISGKVAAFLVEDPIALTYLDRFGERGNFRRLEAMPVTTQVRAGVAKSNGQLMALVRAGLAAISPAELEEIERRWISDPQMRYFGRHNDMVELTPGEKGWLAEHKVIILGGESAWPPLDYADANGIHQGVSADYLQLLGRRLGVRFEVVTSFPWATMLQKVRDKELAGVACIAKRPDREEYLAFSKPYFHCPYMIFTRRDHPAVNSIEDLRGKTMAIEEGFFLEAKLAREYPRIKLLKVPNTEAALQAVADKKADAYVGNLMVANNLLAKHNPGDIRVACTSPWPGSQLRIGVRKDWPQLVGIIDKALDSVGSEEQRRINQRWLVTEEADGERDMLPELTPRERAWLEAHKKIRLGVDPSWPPFEFIGQDGVYSGMASDYVRILRRRLGVEMAPVPNLSWDQAVAMGKAGEIDVFPCITKTPERATYLNFTRPYLSFPMVIVTRLDAPFIAGLDGLGGKLVAVGRNYASHEIMAQNYPDARLKPVPNVKEGLQLLSEGKVDAFVGNLGSVTFFAREAGLVNIKIAASTPYNFSLAIGVRKDWPELVGILEKAMDSIGQRTRNEIHNAWISMRFEHGVDWPYVWRLVGIIVTICLVVFAFFGFWNARLQREVSQRKRAEHALEMAAQELEHKVDERTSELQEAVEALQSEIDEREQVERSLRKSEEEHRAVLEASPNCVIAYDRRGRVIYVNPAFTRTFGWAPEEVIGRTIDFVPGENMPETLQAMEAIFGGKPGSQAYESRRRTKDGRIIDVSASSALLRDAGGEPRGMIVNLADISERRRNEEELRVYRENLERLVDARTAELAVAMERAQEADRLKSAFLASMSHELRTPLNSIIGFTGIILQGLVGPLNEEQAKQMTMVKHSAAHLLSLINDVLDISKIEAGQLTVDSEEVDLREVIAGVERGLSGAAAQKGLELVCKVDRHVGVVRSDRRRVEQILINLINNSIKFTEYGGVYLNCRPVEGFVQITVRDTGIGIRPEDQGKLFEAFQQIDTGLTRRYEGTGLGLNICKKLTELLGGTIWMHSDGEGRGCSFHFTLPRGDGQDE